MNNHNYNYKKSGFTLSEVLITLGIIGVVAALTLPVLIQKHQKQVFVTRMQQTYSLVSNAMMSAVAEYGEPSTWDGFGSFDATDPNYSQNHSDNMKKVATKYFKPYLKVVGEKQEGFQYTMFLSNGVSLTFYPDGGFNSDQSSFNITLVYIIASLNHNSSNFLNSSRDYSRKDLLMQFSTRSKDYRVTFFRGDWTNDSVENFKNDGTYGCNRNIPKNKRLYCGALLFRDSWQIKDYYPW